MNKAELVANLSQTSGHSKRDIEVFLSNFANLVKGEVYVKGNEIAIPGLGTFKRKDVPARTARNPATGGTVQVPAKNKLIFKVSSAIGK